MLVMRTELPDVLLLEPKLYEDARGSFFESYNRRAFKEGTGLDVEFVQDNVSRSVKHVLRGLHYQVRQPQGKLVRVLCGEIWDVAVDLRRRLPTYGKSRGIMLNAESRRAVWIPPGFAHGFLVISESAEVMYKATDYYAPEHERTLLWSDPALGITWPLQADPVVSAKDRAGKLLSESEYYP